MNELALSGGVLAVKLSTSTLLTIGLAFAIVIVAISYSHWRTAVKTAFIIVLIEGAIRKWIFPQGQELVYFLKDVVLIGAYLKFFLSPDFDVRSWRVNIPSFVIGILAVCLTPFAFNPNIGSLLLGVYGLKIYLFYMPLIFMMPFLFRTREEMIKQLNWYMMISIPICLLGLAQWQAGPTSPLNVYAHQDVMDASGATGFGFGEKVRITGTFSYITGHTTFVIFFEVLMLFLLSIKETPRKWILIGVCAPLLLANGMMSGSRAFIYVGALILVGFLMASFAGKVGTNKNFLSILFAGLVICCVGAASVFYDAYFYMSARNTSASDTLKMRTIDHPLASLEYGFKEGGLGGFGIGTTHPATEAMRRAFKIPPPKQRAPVFDMESGQILAELGLFGFLCWYGLRLLLLVVTWQAFSKAPPGPTKTIALATFLVSIPYLMMGLVFNHVSNMLLFGMIGLSMLPMMLPVVYRRNATQLAPAASRAQTTRRFSSTR